MHPPAIKVHLSLYFLELYIRLLRTKHGVGQQYPLVFETATSQLRRKMYCSGSGYEVTDSPAVASVSSSGMKFSIPSSDRTIIRHRGHFSSAAYRTAELYRAPRPRLPMIVPCTPTRPSRTTPIAWHVPSTSSNTARRCLSVKARGLVLGGADSVGNTDAATARLLELPRSR